ncbi:tetraspanin 42Ep [Musca autumnalis]|uniref:tetraspanin 42Ep n=1 Tax=Musca autumnalis TaxID=221902 RepID=UPI003CEFC3A5
MPPVDQLHEETKILPIIAVANLVIDGLGVKYSTPGTEGHAFFILGILLCGLLIMTTVIGCYGVCSEILGVNVIYSLFMASLLIIEYLQIRSFQPHGIYFHTLQSLETAWRVVGTNPKPMDEIQSRLNCCGLFNGQDYAFKHLTIPDSCYLNSSDSRILHQTGCLEAHWKSHTFMTRRQQFFFWALLVTEVKLRTYTYIHTSYTYIIIFSFEYFIYFSLPVIYIVLFHCFLCPHT